MFTCIKITVSDLVIDCWPTALTLVLVEKAYVLCA